MIGLRHGRPLADAFDVMQNECMPKDAAITVRIPLRVKRRLEALARHERRSLSAQVVTCIEESLDSRSAEEATEPSRLLGLMEGARVPTEADFKEVRLLLWGSLGRREPKSRA